MEVWPHAAEQLPRREVDRALSMNTVYFWKDVDAGFANLRRMVRTRLVLGIADPAHLRDVGFERDRFRVQPIDWYAERLRRAGFDARVACQARPRSAALLVGS